MSTIISILQMKKLRLKCQWFAKHEVKTSFIIMITMLFSIFIVLTFALILFYHNGVKNVAPWHKSREQQCWTSSHCIFFHSQFKNRSVSVKKALDTAVESINFITLQLLKACLINMLSDKIGGPCSTFAACSTMLATSGKSSEETE
jgi:hypothetical protein